ncbi:MAG: hypothetical protein Q7S68_02110 [Deltaproteobacteria bacterium]|nr:hypothetical protein [Deltaproteobacteria bacterium]
MNIVMKVCIRLLPLLLVFLASCQTTQFASWQREEFADTAITGSVTKTISLRNDSTTAVQKVIGVGFDGSGDGRQHFQLDRVSVGGKPVSPKEIVVPPGSSLNMQITYSPRNLETTVADFGGWSTGQKEPFRPYKPRPQSGREGEAPLALPAEGTTQAPIIEPEVIHRVVLLAVYESPKSGMTQIELVGHAVPGPNGEISLPEISGQECTPAAGLACFSGNFSIDVPKLFVGGAIENLLPGAIQFGIEEPVASLDMERMPPLMLVLKGNGPGEPLEGQPVSSVTIIIRGVQGTKAEGSFDGSRLELNDLSFRVQVVIGEISIEDLVGLAPIVDFTIDHLRLVTEEPMTDGKITLKIETTLAQNPSGNPVFDEFLGGAQIIVRLIGKLAF